MSNLTCQTSHYQKVYIVCPQSLQSKGGRHMKKTKKITLTFGDCLGAVHKIHSH